MNKRIGPKMQAATDYVRDHPGCTKLAVADHVGPHGSRMFGYRIVDRAISAGLIRAALNHRNAYTLSIS